MGAIMGAIYQSRACVSFIKPVKFTQPYETGVRQFNAALPKFSSKAKSLDVFYFRRWILQAGNPTPSARVRSIFDGVIFKSSRKVGCDIQVQAIDELSLSLSPSRSLREIEAAMKRQNRNQLLANLCPPSPFASLSGSQQGTGI